MSIALHGNLKDFGIAEVFQLIGQQRKTGLLEIAGENQSVELAFDEGAVVWATPIGDGEFSVLGDRLVRCGLITRPRLTELESEGAASARALPSLLVSTGVVQREDLEEINALLSRETIFDVMRWTGGSFHFKAQAIHHEVAPEKLLAAEQILMDGLRMLDEWQTFRALVPSEDTVFEPVGQLEVYRQRVTGEARDRSEQAERVFQLVDGRLPVRRIIDLSRLGTFDASRILADLHQAMMIKIVDGAAAPRRSRPKRTRVPFGARLKFGLAAIVPLLLLAGVVYMGLEGRAAPKRLSGVAVPSHPLAQVRQSFELRRMRHALETRRLIRGDWPETLADGAEDDVLPGFALTQSTRDPYYYVKREDGILLLAPIR